MGKTLLDLDSLKEYAKKPLQSGSPILNTAIRSLNNIIFPEDANFNNDLKDIMISIDNAKENIAESIKNISNVLDDVKYLENTNKRIIEKIERTKYRFKDFKDTKNIKNPDEQINDDIVLESQMNSENNDANTNINTQVDTGSENKPTNQNSDEKSEDITKEIEQLEEVDSKSNVTNQQVLVSRKIDEIDDLDNLDDVNGKSSGTDKVTQFDTKRGPSSLNQLQVKTNFNPDFTNNYAKETKADVSDNFILDIIKWLAELWNKFINKQKDITLPYSKLLEGRKEYNVNAIKEQFAQNLINTKTNELTNLLSINSLEALNAKLVELGYEGFNTLDEVKDNREDIIKILGVEPLLCLNITLKELGYHKEITNLEELQLAQKVLSIQLNEASANETKLNAMRMLASSNPEVNAQFMQAQKVTADIQKKLDAVNGTLGTYQNNVEQIEFALVYQGYEMKIAQENNEVFSNEVLNSDKFKEDLIVYTKKQYDLYVKDNENAQDYVTWVSENQDELINLFIELKYNEWKIDKYYNVDNLTDKQALEFLDESEISTYNYIYVTAGNLAADEYLDFMREELNNRQGQKEAEEFLDKLDGSNSDYVHTALEGYVDGLSSYANGIGNWITGDENLDVSDFKTMYIMQKISSEERYKKYLDEVYNISSTLGTMAIPTLVTTAVSIVSKTAGVKVAGAFSTLSKSGKILKTAQTIAQVSYSASMGGNAYDQALESGHSKGKSAIYGLSVIGTEFVLEKYIGGIPGLSNKSKHIIIDTISEGGEEAIEAFTDGFLRSTILGEQVSLVEMKNEAKEGFKLGVITGFVKNGESRVIDGVTYTVTDFKFLTENGNASTYINSLVKAEINGKTFEEVLIKQNPEMYNNYVEFKNNQTEVKTEIDTPGENLASETNNPNEEATTYEDVYSYSDQRIDVGAEIHNQNKNDSNSALPKFEKAAELSKKIIDTKAEGLRQSIEDHFNTLINEDITKKDDISIHFDALANAVDGTAEDIKTKIQNDSSLSPAEDFVDILEPDINTWIFELDIENIIEKNVSLGTAGSGIIVADKVGMFKEIQYGDQYQNFVSKFDLYKYKKSQKKFADAPKMEDHYYYLNRSKRIFDFLQKKDMDDPTWFQSLVNGKDAFGNIDIETGKIVENLIFNDDLVFGIHRAGSGTDSYVAENIIENGLWVTGDISSGVGKNMSKSLDKNISFASNDKITSLITAIANLKGAHEYKASGIGNAILFAFPKDAINNGKANLEKYPDLLVVNKHQTAVNPKYIVGYVNNDNGNVGKINFNPKFFGVEVVQDADSNNQVENLDVDPNPQIDILAKSNEIASQMGNNQMTNSNPINEINVNEDVKSLNANPTGSYKQLVQNNSEVGLTMPNAKEMVSISEKVNDTTIENEQKELISSSYTGMLGKTINNGLQKVKSKFDTSDAIPVNFVEVDDGDNSTGSIPLIDKTAPEVLGLPSSSFGGMLSQVIPGTMTVIPSIFENVESVIVDAANIVENPNFQKDQIKTAKNYMLERYNKLLEFAKNNDQMLYMDLENLSDLKDYLHQLENPKNLKELMDEYNDNIGIGSYRQQILETRIRELVNQNPNFNYVLTVNKISEINPNIFSFFKNDQISFEINGTKLNLEELTTQVLNNDSISATADLKKVLKERQNKNMLIEYNEAPNKEEYLKNISKEGIMSLFLSATDAEIADIISVYKDEGFFRNINNGLTFEQFNNLAKNKYTQYQMKQHFLHKPTSPIDIKMMYLNHLDIEIANAWFKEDIYVPNISLDFIEFYDKLTLENKTLLLEQAISNYKNTNLESNKINSRQIIDMIISSIPLNKINNASITSLVELFPELFLGKVNEFTQEQLKYLNEYIDIKEKIKIKENFKSFEGIIKLDFDELRVKAAMDFVDGKMKNLFERILGSKWSSKWEGDLLERIHFQRTKIFKENVSEESAMGYNNSTGSFIDIGRSYIQQIVSHETLHDISRIGDVSGFRTRQLFRGINECTTEYINKLLYEQDYSEEELAEITATGYDLGVKRIKMMVNYGIINQSELIDAYMSNNPDYWKNICKSDREFDKLMENFNKASNRDIEGVKQLDKFIFKKRLEQLKKVIR